MPGSSAAAEVTEAWTQGPELRVRARVTGAATVELSHARLLATSRGTAEEVLGLVGGPGAVSDSRVELRLGLETLAGQAASGKQVWDLWLAIPAGQEPSRRLRLGAPRRRPGAPSPVVEFPAQEVGDGDLRRRTRVYYTDRDNLSVRSDPVRPAPAGSAPAWWSDRGAELLLRVLARIANPAAAGKRARPDEGATRPPVYFLLLHAYGMGGTIRTTVNTANYLAAQGWRVEIISVLRTRDRMTFPLDRRVKVRALCDKRPGARRPSRHSRSGRAKTLLVHRLADRLSALPSVLCPPEEYAFGSLTMWTDVLMLRRLRSLPPGVLVSTRPVLNLVAARFAPASVLTIGQEHLNAVHHPERLRRQLTSAYARLDALTVLTRADETDYAALLGPAGPRVVRIPNALPELGKHSSDLSGKVVVAVGRLTRQKGFDLLVRAFRLVADAHPDWELRIFGAGKEQASLERLIATQSLATSVHLMGPTDNVGEELAKASIFALSSRFEGLPMVLLEAMSVGLAVVSFDCPQGPRDVITDGINGALVPAGDVDSFAARVCELIEHEETRRAMGRAAKDRSRDYALDRVGPRWEAMIESLLARPAGGLAPRARRA